MALILSSSSLFVDLTSVINKLKHNIIAIETKITLQKFLALVINQNLILFTHQIINSHMSYDAKHFH